MRELKKFIAECEKNAIPDSQIDTSEIPELTAEDFARGHFKNWRPVKKTMTMNIDADVLAELRKSGRGWQTRLNDFIRKAVYTGQI